MRSGLLLLCWAAIHAIHADALHFFSQIKATTHEVQSLSHLHVNMHSFRL